MKIFLVGNGHNLWVKDNFFSFNFLSSFFYMTSNEARYIHRYNNFLLDSGAFTFMNNLKGGTVNWDDYIERYAAFINEYNVKYFFELDIDVIVGIKEVERLRNKLELLTNKKCIPVWHKSRGKQYWLDMVKSYDYVAIGGIVTREIKPKEYPYFTWFLNEAKKENCKVHGLGFTNPTRLRKYPFYSVDSTSWVSGNRFGSVSYFNGETIVTRYKKQGQRVKTNEVAKHNFYEWIKFAEYAEKYL